jgi:Ca2+-binding EF-hand superfamily protein
MPNKMTMTRSLLSILALVAVTGAALSTAVQAQDAEAPAADLAGTGPDLSIGGIDFATLDTDKDGKISAAEMAAFRTARVTEADTDQDGKLSAAELSAMHLARMQARAEAMATRMIERHDADGDGLLTVAEMATPPAPQRLFERADTDGDGALSEAELQAARDRMAEMREGRGKGRGHGHGRGDHGAGWFFRD